MSFSILLTCCIAFFSVQRIDAGYCRQYYSCSYGCTRSTSYSTSCGFWYGSTCRHYKSVGHTCYTTCSRNVCCTGYIGTHCSNPICYGSTSCPNGGTCVSPNNCKCAVGYTGSQCSAPLCYGSTSCPNGGTCVSPNNCTCAVGYTGSQCSDYDECEEGQSGCSQVCKNLHGSFRCSCHDGYVLHYDRKTCLDPDNCIGVGCQNDGTCKDEVANFTCLCQPGFTGRLCEQDINECLQSTECDVCENTVGSYRCTCHEGYSLQEDGRSCQDIDECLIKKKPCFHTCINIPGSYQCNCFSGFQLEDDKTSCKDTDECEEGQSDCSQVCINFYGSFRCSCHDGYVLHNDRKTCLDPDNCIGVDCRNGGTCKDGVATFTCLCQSGYFGRLCDEDVDECSFGNGGCEDICINEEGSYTCSCSGNETLQSDGRTCTGKTDEDNIFSKNNISRQLLPEGCFSVTIPVCSKDQSDSINLTSTSQWLQSDMDPNIYFTHGISFLEKGDLSLPVSLSGVKVFNDSGKIEVQTQLHSGTDIKPSLKRTSNCFEIETTPRDVYVLYEAGSFFKTIIESINSALPIWLRFLRNEQSLLDNTDTKSDVVDGSSIRSTKFCEDVPIQKQNTYSLFRFDTAFNITVFGSEIFVPPSLDGDKFCISIDICQSAKRSFTLMIPSVSRVSMKTVTDKFELTPKGFAIYIQENIDVNPPPPPISWNGSNNKEFDEANVWIGGDLEGELDLDVIDISIKGFTDIFLYVQNMGKMFTTILYDGIHGYLKTSISSLNISVAVFGDRHNLFLPDLKDKYMDGFISYDGFHHRSVYDNIPYQQNYYSSFTLSDNPFKDIPILREWAFDESDTFHILLGIDHSVTLHYELEQLIQSDEIFKMKEVTSIILERLSFSKLLINATGRLQQSLMHFNSTLDSFVRAVYVSNSTDGMQILDDVIDSFAAYRSNETLFSDYFEFSDDIGVKEITALIESDTRILQENLNTISRTVFQSLLSKLLQFKYVVLRFVSSIKIFDFVLGKADIELFYTPEHTNVCRGLNTSFDCEHSILISGEITSETKLGSFLRTQFGVEIKGALSSKNVMFVFETTVYVEMLGINTFTIATFTERSLVFYIEGIIWDSFFVQIDVEMKYAIYGWVRSVYQLQGKFSELSTDNSHNSTLPLIFQERYLHEIRQEILPILEEENTRILFYKNALSFAEDTFTKATLYLNKKEIDFQEANATFFEAKKYLENSSNTEDIKESYEEIVQKLGAVNIYLDEICDLKSCQRICIVGISCELNTNGIPSCRVTDCMFTVPNPTCIISNEVCSILRTAVYTKQIGSDEIDANPFFVYNNAVTAVDVAKLRVEKSSVRLKFHMHVLDIAKHDLKELEQSLESARDALYAVINDGINSLNTSEEVLLNNIAVRNCGFDIEMSAPNLTDFCIHCEVDIFNYSLSVNFEMNFKDPVKSLKSR